MGDKRGGRSGRGDETRGMKGDEEEGVRHPVKERKG